MRLLRSPVLLFLGLAILTAVGILVGTNLLADSAAEDEAIAEARGTTQVLAHNVVGPAFDPRLIDISSESRNGDGYVRVLDRFDQEVNDLLSRRDRPYRINIWAEDGSLVYSSDLGILLKSLAGNDERISLDGQQQTILRNGGVGSEIVELEDNAHGAAAGTDGMVRINTRFIARDKGTPQSEGQGTKGTPLLFEAYYSRAHVSERQTQIFDSFRWITLGGLVLLIAVATVILVALTRQIRRGAQERERLLQTAMDASDAERRRIARDLHDGVVQDLAGTAFSLSAVARTPELPSEGRETLDKAGRSLRGSLKSLRSLLAEIHPPDLRADGLAAALGDLIAPAGTVGMQASVSVEGAETASDDQAALVWRVAQEAVRNAIRHSHASTLAVTVRGDQERLTLEVVDDGIGFDPKVTAPDSFGLRGLRSLVADHGGVLEVRSAPGEGTTVRMEVEAQ